MRKATSEDIITTEDLGDKMYFDTLSEKALRKGIELNLPVLLVGETGVGKTSYIRSLAKERGVELIRLNLTGQTGVDEILGKWLANSSGMYWIDGLLINAMKEGKWIVFDEINMALPEILSVLHSLLDDDRKIVLKEHEGEKVTCHENFRFFATMNPSDEYSGTKELNKAFLSRFPIINNIDYSTEESQIIADRTGMKIEHADKIVLIAKDIRDLKSKEKISYTCSTRDILAFSNLIVNGFSIAEAFDLSIVNKVVSQEERTIIKKIAELVTGENMTINVASGGRILEFKNFSEIRKLVEDAERLKIKSEENVKRANKELEEVKKVAKKEIDEIKATVKGLSESGDKEAIDKLSDPKKISQLREKYLISERLIKHLCKEFSISSDIVKDAKFNIKNTLKTLKS
jgi:midasin (ATPase involved in ribosome maturation)